MLSDEEPAVRSHDIRENDLNENDAKENIPPEGEEVFGEDEYPVVSMPVVSLEAKLIQRRAYVQKIIKECQADGARSVKINKIFEYNHTSTAVPVLFPALGYHQSHTAQVENIRVREFSFTIEHRKSEVMLKYFFLVRDIFR